MKAPLEWLQKQYATAVTQYNEAERRLRCLEFVLNLANEDSTEVDQPVNEPTKPKPIVVKEPPAKKKPPVTPPPEPKKNPNGSIGTDNAAKERALELLRSGMAPMDAYKQICKERKAAGLSVFSHGMIYIWKKEVDPECPANDNHQCLRPGVPHISPKSCIEWQWKWRSGNAKPTVAIDHLKECSKCESYIKSSFDLQTAYDAATGKKV